MNDQTDSSTNNPRVAERAMTKKEVAAAYQHKWYIEHRAERLRAQKARYVPRPKRTPEQIAKSRRRAARTLKHTLKTLPKSKQRNMRRGLKSGWQKKIEEAKARREQWAWDIITWRLDEVPFNEIVRKSGLNLKVVNDILREAEIPKGKKFLMDRGVPFTRAMGTQLRNALDMGYKEFALLISTPEKPVRTRRVEIWTTASQNRLDPPEARICIGWRRRIVEKLLETEPGGRDSYNRSSVLLALFPRLKVEYRLILKFLPAIRQCLRDNPAAEEKAIGNSVIKSSRRFPLWIPKLMPLIEKEREAIRGTGHLRHVAVKILARNCPAPANVVESALHKSVPAIAPRKMRELFRIHFPEESAKVGLLSAIPTVRVTKTSRKFGPDKSPYPETESYKTGKKVQDLIDSGVKQSDARHAVADSTRRQYSSVEIYHKEYRSWLKKNP